MSATLRAMRIGTRVGEQTAVVGGPTFSCGDQRHRYGHTHTIPGGLACACENCRREARNVRAHLEDEMPRTTGER